MQNSFTSFTSPQPNFSPFPTSYQNTQETSNNMMASPPPHNTPNSQFQQQQQQYQQQNQNQNNHQQQQQQQTTPKSQVNEVPNLLFSLSSRTPRKSDRSPLLSPESSSQNKQRQQQNTPSSTSKNNDSSSNRNDGEYNNNAFKPQRTANQEETRQCFFQNKAPGQQQQQQQQQPPNVTNNNKDNASVKNTSDSDFSDPPPTLSLGLFSPQSRMKAPKSSINSSSKASTTNNDNTPLKSSHLHNNTSVNIPSTPNTPYRLSTTTSSFHQPVDYTMYVLIYGFPPSSPSFVNSIIERFNKYGEIESIVKPTSKGNEERRLNVNANYIAVKYTSNVCVGKALCQNGSFHADPSEGGGVLIAVEALSERRCRMLSLFCNNGSSVNSDGGGGGDGLELLSGMSSVKKLRNGNGNGGGGGNMNTPRAIKKGSSNDNEDDDLLIPENKVKDASKGEDGVMGLVGLLRGWVFDN